jgi:hypothetical protein
MKRALPLAAWIMLLWHLACAQDVVNAWLPTHIGDSWTYQREERNGGDGGGIAHPEIARWRVEETIKGSIAIPEGVLLRKQIRAVDPIPVEVRRHIPGIQELQESYDLIRGNCVYRVEKQVDPTRGQLASEYRKELLDGRLSPEFCFPLTKGATWGRGPDTSPAEEFVWRVIGINADPFGPSDGTTFRLSTHAGSGKQVDRWFEPGIGVLQEIREHHGTYEESRLQLLSAVIDGRTHTFLLKPARTIPLSDADCDGPGWQHFARLDGTGFANQSACVTYASRK